MRQRITAKGARTKQIILQAVVQLARDEGMTRITLNQVSDASGISKSGLFRYFINREALLCAGVDAWAAEFKVRVINPALQETGVVRVWRLCERWLSGYDQLTPPVDVFRGSKLEDLQDPEGEVRFRTAQVLRGVHDFIEEALERAKVRGELLEAVDPADLALEVVTSLISVPALSRMFGARSGVERTAKALLATLGRCVLHKELLPDPFEAIKAIVCRLTGALAFQAPRLSYGSSQKAQLRLHPVTGRVRVTEPWDADTFNGTGAPGETLGTPCRVCFYEHGHDPACSADAVPPRPILWPGVQGVTDHCPYCLAVAGHLAGCIDWKLAPPEPDPRLPSQPPCSVSISAAPASNGGPSVSPAPNGGEVPGPSDEPDS
jgi:AcrR family transcriptional regulator